MPKLIEDGIDPGPFLAWFDARVEELEPDYEDARSGSPQIQVFGEMGWTDHSDDAATRRINRWRNGEAQSGVSRAVIEAALDAAGVDIGEVYPEFAVDVELEDDAFCERCHELVTPIGGHCPWCDTPTSEPTRVHAYCQACDKMVYPRNDGSCWRCSGITSRGLPYTACECGCKTMIHRFDRYGRRVRWVLGHAPRGREGPGTPLPTEPFAQYLERQLAEMDVLEALAQMHGIKREDVAWVLNRRGEEIPRRLVHRALWVRSVGSVGSQLGRRPDIPTLYELYPDDARSRVCPHCGGGKASHAEMCKKCRRRRDPSYMNGGPPASRGRFIGEDVIAEARALYQEDPSYVRVARRIIERTSYKNVESCAQALRYALDNEAAVSRNGKTLGRPARPTNEGER